MKIALGLVGTTAPFPLTVVPGYKYTIDGGTPILAAVAPYSIEAELSAGDHIVTVELFNTVTDTSLAPAATTTLTIPADTQAILVPTGVQILA